MDKEKLFDFIRRNYLAIDENIDFHVDGEVIRDKLDRFMESTTAHVAYMDYLIELKLLEEYLELYPDTELDTQMF